MATLQAKIADIEAEMARTQKNKATEGHLGLLKAKMAKLKRELIEGSNGCFLSSAFYSKLFNSRVAAEVSVGSMCDDQNFSLLIRKVCFGLGDELRALFSG